MFCVFLEALVSENDEKDVYYTKKFDFILNIFLVLGIYILLVVFSLFMEIRKKEKGAEHGQHDACSPQK